MDKIIHTRVLPIHQLQLFFKQPIPVQPRCHGVNGRACGIRVDIFCNAGLNGGQWTAAHFVDLLLHFFKAF
jgi:hypothetical protein